MGFYSDDSFDPDRSLGYLLRRTHQMGVAALEPVLAEEGLSSLQWSALVLVCLGRSTTPADLARDLVYDKGATTRLLDLLEARALVTRVRCTDDRRVVRLAATDQGMAVALRCKARVIGCWNDWLEGWDDADVVSLILLLQKLRDTMERVTADRLAADRLPAAALA